MLVPFRQRKRVCMNLNCRGERKANKKMSPIFLILVLVFVMELPDLKSIDTMYKIVRYVLQNYFVAICHFLVSTLSTVLGLLGHGEHCFCVIKRSSTYTRRVRYDDACHIDDQGVCQSATCGFWSTWRTSRSSVGSERVRSRRHHSVPLTNFRLNHRQPPAKRHQHQV